MPRLITAASIGVVVASCYPGPIDKSAITMGFIAFGTICGIYGAGLWTRQKHLEC